MSHKTEIKLRMLLDNREILSWDLLLKSSGLNKGQFFFRDIEEQPNYLDSLRTLPGPVSQSQSSFDSKTPIENTQSGNVKSQFKLPLIPKSSKIVTFQSQPETILPSMTQPPPANMSLLKLSPPTLILPPPNSPPKYLPPPKSLKRQKRVSFVLPPISTYDCDHK